MPYFRTARLDFRMSGIVKRIQFLILLVLAVACSTPTPTPVPTPLSPLEFGLREYTSDLHATGLAHEDAANAAWAVMSAENPIANWSDRRTSLADGYRHAVLAAEAALAAAVFCIPPCFDANRAAHYAERAYLWAGDGDSVITGGRRAITRDASSDADFADAFVEALANAKGADDAIRAAARAASGLRSLKESAYATAVSDATIAAELAAAALAAPAYDFAHVLAAYAVDLAEIVLSIAAEQRG